MRNYGDTCPIAAQASGQGALALIRTSGEGALDRLSRVFSRPGALLGAPGNTIVHGWICAANEKPDMSRVQRLDEVLVSVYRAPKSYTGEEGVDISCHGGSAAVRAIMETLRNAGFLDALPGEFTFRAFMNGKIDLTQSESVMELVSAKTAKGLEHAVKRLSGALEKEIHAVRDAILETLSAVELYLDYPEDELAEIDETAETGTLNGDAGLPRRKTAEEALSRLRALAASYRREQLYREGALAVIAGRPNAGKSSLFNALLNEDRSIVTEFPGTTRDWIEAALSLEGIPLRLADTAGLRDAVSKEKTAAQKTELESAELQGISRSRELIGGADVIMYVVDGGEGLNAEDEAFLDDHDGPLVLVWNKNDLRNAPEELKKRFVSAPSRRFTALSAKTGEGIETLCAFLTDLLEKKSNPAENTETSAGLGTLRQKTLVEKALSALEEALELADQKESFDIIAPRLREALDMLGEITGEVSSADILETMFSRFCLGK